MSDVTIDTFVLGPFATNCYLVRSGGSGWLVDVGFEAGPLIEAARDSGAQIEKIILTHAHADHMGELDAARAAFPDAKVMLHENEASWLGDPVLNLSAGFGAAVTAAPADELLTGGEELKLGDSVWRVLEVPGHSPGSIALYNEAGRTLIAGDTLFAGSIGRYDFPTSDGEQLMRSIREQLYTLPAETRVFPGHGGATTIGRERQTNPFVRG